MTLITDDYRVEQKRLHEADSAYGSRGFNWGYLLAGMAVIEKCRSVLDYGCGKGSLARTLTLANLDVRQYDPAITGLDSPPILADLVACIDVLEHIEPDLLPAVIADLERVTNSILFVTIATRPAGRTLSDGRNAHLIVQPAEWWRVEMERHFRVKRTWAGVKDTWIAMLRPHRHAEE